VEEAWDRAPDSGPDLTSDETPQWGFASFALQPSPERCSQASLGEPDKWIETRSVLEDTTVPRFLLEGEDTQAPHEESVKGPNCCSSTGCIGYIRSFCVADTSLLLYTLLYLRRTYCMLLLYMTDQWAVYLYRQDLSCNQQQ